MSALGSEGSGALVPPAQGGSAGHLAPVNAQQPAALQLRRYVEAGFALVPIPLGQKGPNRRGWNLRENCVVDAEGAMALRGNVGLAHAYSRTAVLDIDDLEKTRTLLKPDGIDVDVLLNAQDAVQIVSGKPNRAKLLYRLPEGCNPLPTRQVKGIFELRCATDDGLTAQDVLPPSIHPDTGKPYRWGGAGSFEALPELPAAVLAHWRHLNVGSGANPKRFQKAHEAFADDTVLAVLRDRGLVRQENPDGKVWIDCPFEDQHTSPAQPFGTSYFVAHTNGFKRGHFRCLHAHCADRKDQDFLQILGLADSADDAFAQFDQIIPAGQRRADDGVLLRCANTLEPEAVRWLWDGWLARGKFHVLAGSPGQGKTTIALSFAAILSSGGQWPDGTECEPANVLIWSGEDDANDTLVPRLLAMGADRNHIFIVEGTQLNGKKTPFDPARDLASLTQQAQLLGSVGLLIVDPVVSAVPGDSHKNAEVRRGLQPLVDLGSYLGAAVLGISHFSKGTDKKDPTERVTGSVAFGAVARIVLCAAKVKGEHGEEDRRVFARSKSNIGPDDGGFAYTVKQKPLEGYPDVTASLITWGEKLDGDARDLLAAPEDDHATASKAAEDFLEELFILGAAPAVEIRDFAEKQGLSKGQIDRAARKLGVVKTKGGMKGGWVWSLPSPLDDSVL